ncbi:hypothetical protein LEP48_16520 [Isoptericola sp. NEAU-Y5]|uniref:Uncharacterized protein n=1 Tax=Isoptericola luteus TaxID=2879484 RepID=A0ABS7ZIV0_9MICO|nr:hypothetical protein [Isoptericola sp. NEAU-Y5]MCA5894938.1 hypothetical protein [Isoptericola sp. NEAU-Y5]
MWFRRPSLPDDVRRTLPLARGERVLAAAELADGAWTVATTTALAVVTDASVRLHRPWSDVDHAAYDPERSVLTVEWVDATGDTPLELVDAERTSFTQAFRERVQWSVVLAETVAVPGGGQVKVAVRRSAGGALFSQAIAGPGVDLDDPAVARVVDATESRVRGASGLPA